MKSNIIKGHSKILAAIALVSLLFAVVFFISLRNGVKTKETQLQALKLQLQELEEENSRLDYLINEADEAELFEHLARDRGYVYPDEKIFYNVSPGN